MVRALAGDSTMTNFMAAAQPSTRVFLPPLTPLPRSPLAGESRVQNLSSSSSAIQRPRQSRDPARELELEQLGEGGVDGRGAARGELVGAQRGARRQRLPQARAQAGK